MSTSLAAKRAALARASRKALHDPTEQPSADQARAAYQAAKLEDYIRRAVDSAPPLTAEQRDRLALLLTRGGGDA